MDFVTYNLLHLIDEMFYLGNHKNEVFNRIKSRCAHVLYGWGGGGGGTSESSPLVGPMNPS